MKSGRHSKLPSSLAGGIYRGFAARKVPLPILLAAPPPNNTASYAGYVKVSGVNKILKTFCNQNGWGYVDHSNISPEQDLNRSGLHLNTKGTARLATNFINYLRGD